MPKLVLGDCQRNYSLGKATKKPLSSGEAPTKTRVFYRFLRFLPLFIILYVLLYAWLKTSQETFYIVDIDAFRFFAHKKVSAVSAGIG